ncbi:MAG: AEC family transporter, partial [Amylibacter sp.]
MNLVLLQILPFFALIGLGFYAGKIKFFSPEATASLSKFVFYFALSALLFRFAANLSLAETLDWPFIGAYICGTGSVYLLTTAVALFRRVTLQEAAI